MAFVACFDILGFKNILRIQGSKKLFEKLFQFTKLISIISGNEKFNINSKNYQPVENTDSCDVVILSDTIVLYRKDDQVNDFRLILNAANKLIQVGFEMSLPLRGAIAQGNFEYQPPVIVSEALVEACTTGENTSWSGAVLAKSAERFYESNKTLFDQNPLFLEKYPVPQKSVCQTDYYCIDWTRDPQNSEQQVQIIPPEKFNLLEGAFAPKRSIEIMNHTIKFQQWMHRPVNE